jgi:hypothetical protein
MGAAILLGIGLGAGAFTLQSRGNVKPAAAHADHGAPAGTTYE